MMLLAPTPPPRPARTRRPPPDFDLYLCANPSGSKKHFTALSASEFFTQALEVAPPNSDGTFRAYLSPPTVQPAANQRNKQGCYLVCHHGAGASALSFAALAKEVAAKSGAELGVFAFDARGHGELKRAVE